MTRVMGILNTTPDSFSDGGCWSDHERALRHAVSMVAGGADIIDVGGESTRPGATAVSVHEEIDRVAGVIESLVAETDALVSIDTSKPEVMEAAVSAGAGMVNDVYALRRDGAMEMAVKLGVPVCLMHMQGEPRDMQHHPVYTDVVREVIDFLLERARACELAGIPAAQLVIDPGFGFGKTLEHNLELFHALGQLTDMAYPVLVGVSRKAMLGSLTGKPAGDRVMASVTAAVLAAQSGAAIVRVHDVAETVEALAVASALSHLQAECRHNG
ncbi:MAG: dihydropteroate synthase [Gammaproteobacteria bacterium]|jgi:dihydropteroate synthase|nr:dihydropteroate synthase [Gammaproteobacteria bacterium]